MCTVETLKQRREETLPSFVSPDMTSESFSNISELSKTQYTCQKYTQKRTKESFTTRHTALGKCRLSLGGRIYYVKTPYWLHLDYGKSVRHSKYEIALS